MQRTKIARRLRRDAVHCRPLGTGCASCGGRSTAATGSAVRTWPRLGSVTKACLSPQSGVRFFLKRLPLLCQIRDLMARSCQARFPWNPSVHLAPRSSLMIGIPDLLMTPIPGGGIRTRMDTLGVPSQPVVVSMEMLIGRTPKRSISLTSPGEDGHPNCFNLDDIGFTRTFHGSIRGLMIHAAHNTESFIATE